MRVTFLFFKNSISLFSGGSSGSTSNITSTSLSSINFIRSSLFTTLDLALFINTDFGFMRSNKSLSIIFVVSLFTGKCKLIISESLNIPVKSFFIYFPHFSTYGS